MVEYMVEIKYSSTVGARKIINKNCKSENTKRAIPGRFASLSSSKRMSEMTHLEIKLYYPPPEQQSIRFHLFTPSHSCRFCKHGMRFVSFGHRQRGAAGSTGHTRQNHFWPTNHSVCNLRLAKCDLFVQSTERATCSRAIVQSNSIWCCEVMKWNRWVYFFL